AMAVDRSNNLVLARDDGISVVNPQRDHIQHFDIPQRDYSNTVSVQEVFVDSSDTIWLGTKGAGAGIFDPATSQFHFYNSFTDGSSPPILSDNIAAIAQDHQGDLWFGAHDGGLSRLAPGSTSFRNYVYDPADPSSITHNAIRDIY